MPDLDPIIQELILEAAEFIDGMDLAVEKMESGEHASEDLAMVLEVLEERFDVVAEKARDAAFAIDAAGHADEYARDEALALAQAENILADAIDRVKDAMFEAAIEEAALDHLMTAFAVDAGKAAQAADDTANSSARAARFTIGWWRVTGNALHWIISGTAEYLAVAIPGAIALALGAFVMYQGAIEDVGTKLRAMYTTTEATSSMLHKTTGDVLGLGHAFQTAQNEADPIAYQILGAYINTARQHMVNFAAVGYQVAGMFRSLALDIQYDLTSGSKEFTGLLSHMTSDLQQFGQILGNIGHAILNFASDMPGLAEVLLSVLDGLSKVILEISKLPHWLIEGFFAFEEFVRWGGLLAGVLWRLVDVVARVAIGMQDFATAGALSDVSNGLKKAAQDSTHFGSVLQTVVVGSVVGVGKAIRGAITWVRAFAADVLMTAEYEGVTEAATFALVFSLDSLKAAILAIPGWGWALAAAILIGGLVFVLSRGKSAAEQFGESLEKSVASSSNVNALSTIANAVGSLNTQMSHTSKYIDTYTGAASRFGPSFAAWGNSVKTVSSDYQTLTHYQSELITQFQNVAGGASYLSQKYHITTQEALGLADVAGVKLYKGLLGSGEAATKARYAIDDLVVGYERMDQTGGILRNDLNAVSVQAGLQNTKVQALNQAWDQFVSNSTSVTGALASLNQDLAEVGNEGVRAGQKFNVFTGQYQDSMGKIAAQLTTFTGKGAQAWQNYDAAINQAEQYTDSLRTAAAYGGISQAHYREAIAYTVAEMLPLAKRSRTAADELSTLAQQGGEVGTSFQSMKSWIDKNKISTSQFNQIIQGATYSMSNAGQAALQFASDLQTDLQAQIAKSTLDSAHLNQAMNNFQHAVLASGGQISTSSPQYKQLYDLLRAAGYSAKQARNELKLLQGTIDAMHGKNVNVNVATRYTSSGGVGYVPPAGGSGTEGGGGNKVHPSAVHVHINGSVASKQDITRAVQAGLNQKTIRNGSTQLFISGRRH